MARQVGTFRNVGDVLAAFVERGCELRTAEAAIESGDGDVWSVRYLVNLNSGAFVPLVDLSDDDSVSGVEIAFWERRLGVVITSPG